MIVIILLILLYLLRTQTYSGSGDVAATYTYTLVKNNPQDSLDEKQLVAILPPEFKRVDFGPKEVDLCIGYLTRVQTPHGLIDLHPQNYLAQRARLKSLTSENARITDRRQLFVNLATVAGAEKYTPKWIQMNNSSNLQVLEQFSPLIICKAAKTSGGEGVFVINNNPVEFVRIQPRFANKKNPDGDAIITDYIVDIRLTPNNKKFHLRAYLLCVSGKSQKYHAYLFKRFRVYTAREKYVKADYSNKDIHDSHIKSTDMRWEFPRDFPGAQCDKITDLARCVAEAGRGISSYDDTGFEVFAIDILIGSDNTPFILEVNNRVSYNRHGPSKGWLKYNEEFSRDYFKWVSDCAILPFFGKTEWPESLVS